jgi:hypothetical protein
MAGRMAYAQAGVTATIVQGKSITLTAKNACSVPVTGLAAPVALKAGQTLTVKL